MGCNKVKSFPISPKLMEIIEGELLGDGSMKKGIHQSGFSHHSSNKEYSKYLSSKFIEYGIPLIGNGVVAEHYQNKKYYSFQTVKTIDFHHIRNLWYGDKKRIPNELNITPTIVLHWWLGDGSVRNGVSGIFCTDCFSLDDINLLKKKLDTNISIKSRIVLEKNKYYRISIPCQYMGQFLNYIGESPVKSLSYKWNVRNPKKIRKSIHQQTRII